MLLTAIKVSKAATKTTAYVLNDGRGLGLLVHPNGSRYWQLRYTFNSQRRRASLGVYPAISLAAARAEAEKMRTMLATGIDPLAEKEADKERLSFREIGQDWIKAKMTDQGHDYDTVGRAQHYLDLLADHPQISSKKINQILPPDILAVTRTFSAQGKHDTARRIRSIASRVFKFGVAIGACDRDIAADLSEALTAPTVTKRPRITDPAKVGELMRDIDGYRGKGDIVGMALRYLAVTMVRPGEVMLAEWSEIDFDKKLWAIPATRMKMRRPHEVPLSRQALAILRTMQERDGSSPYVFTFGREPLSNATFNKALRVMGYCSKTEHCAHGFRATASTLLNGERHNSRPVWHPDVIELQLAHVDKNRIRGTYNDAQYWPERVALMQHWADRLDALRDGSNVVKLARAV
jgi:integrase